MSKTFHSSINPQCIQMSARPSTTPPLIRCSGAAYWKFAIRSDCFVSTIVARLSDEKCAIPKSAITAFPLPSIKIFSGLISLCHTPFSCAKRSPDRICVIIGRTLLSATPSAISPRSRLIIYGHNVKHKILVINRICTVIKNLYYIRIITVFAKAISFLKRFIEVALRLKVMIFSKPSYSQRRHSPG